MPSAGKPPRISIGMGQQKILGQPRARVDGVAKVTGHAAYSGDRTARNMLHAALVQSTIARGRVLSIDTAAAAQTPGFVAAYTHKTLPPLQPPPAQFTESFPAERRAPLSDDVIHYAGQHLAIVLAETPEQLARAVSLIRVEYAPQAPTLDLRADLPGAYQPDHFATNSKEKLQSTRGEPGPSAVTVDLEYDTPVETHNPMELSACLALWKGDRLLLYDSTRWVQGEQRILAAMLAIPEPNIEVRAPFVGGAFGSKGFLWQHVAIAAQAARACGRPVKLMLTRAQMFTSTGHRPRTRQHLILGADSAGSLTTVQHHTLSETSEVAHFVEPAGMTSRNLYRTAHAAISHTVVPTSLATPCFMRAPGESPGMFALESAIDELAERAHLDPLDFRIRNDAERDLTEDRPWSSKHLEACYRKGAEILGWSERKAAPASMRRDGKLIGYGMATAAYPARRSPCTVRASWNADGTASFSAATHAIGTGTATVMEQIAAQVLQVPLSQVQFTLGDSILTTAPIAGASQTTASVGPAVHEAACRLRDRLQTEGTRNPITVEASARLDDKLKEQYTFHSFGAHFVELEVDEALASLRLRRWVTVVDCGRILNPMSARSQILGAVTFGIGMALMEQTLYDPRTGAPVNANLADYLVPTCADVPPIDVHFIEEPDLLFDPLGARGIGEIGITGVPAAIANALWNATGIRIRSLPITPDRLIQQLDQPQHAA